MTVVMWIIGCVFSRMWNMEWKRQQHAFELRDRVQLHALAMDILNNPVISPGMLQDPCLRRQLLMKLRSQRTLDLRYGKQQLLESRFSMSWIFVVQWLFSFRKKLDQRLSIFKDVTDKFLS